MKNARYSVHNADTSCTNVDRVYTATAKPEFHVGFGESRYIIVHSGHPVRTQVSPHRYDVSMCSFSRRAG